MKERNTIESRILELLYRGESESVILKEIVKQAQDIDHDSICSVLCTDEEGKYLLLGAAPDLPDFYNKAVDGIPIGFGIGACGTAAFTGKRVIVEDIYSHPYCKDIKAIAQRAELASCWSEPIKDSEGNILGTFDNYHRVAHIPDVDDIAFVEGLADLTAVVLDRFRMLRKLEDSEKKYKKLANASNEAVFIIEGDKIIEVNKRAEEITGYSKFELSRKSIFDFVSQEYWVSSNAKLPQRKRHQIKANGIKKNGDRIDCIINIKNSRFKGKEVCLLSVNDVSSLVRAEKELRILSQSVIQSPTSVVVTDYNGDIEFVNPKFVELTGYSLEEVKGKNPRILSSGCNHIDVYKSLWKTIKSGNEWRGELQNKKKNGELFWEFAIISALKDSKGQITNFIGVKEDITERKRQEQIQQIILNISNAFFSQNTLVEFIDYIRNELSKLMDTTNFFVALYDDETKTFHLPYFDDQFDSIESFPKGKTISGWVVDNAISLLVSEKDLYEMKARGEIELLGEVAKIWLGIPLKGKEKVIGVLVVQSYENEWMITEKDRDMLELISHQISISIEKKRTEQELHKALKNATESDRLKSVFLATMSHELRTPLNAVIGFSELVEEGTSCEAAIEYCKLINHSGKNLLNIVEDLFDTSLIQSGDVKISHERYPLFNLLYEIHDVIMVEKKVLNKENVTLQLVLPSNYQNFIINTDPNRFRQIFLNLLKNALKFTESGSIEFGLIEREEKYNSLLLFYVKDTGIGIPNEKKDSIFGIFRQANESLSRMHNGVGIGLSISKSLTELLGGKIWFESVENIGTTFYFTHPVE